MNLADLAPFFPLFVATLVTTGISGLGLWLSRKLGLTPAQAKYVETLEGFNETLEKKVEFVEGELHNCNESSANLTAENLTLKTKNAELVQTIFELRQEIYDNKPKRRGRATPTEDE